MNRSVLFVDDDPTLLEAMVRDGKTEFQVLTAETLDQANHFLQTRHVDVIVSDGRMPVDFRWNRVSFPAGLSLPPDVVTYFYRSNWVVFKHRGHKPRKGLSFSYQTL